MVQQGGQCRTLQPAHWLTARMRRSLQRSLEGEVGEAGDGEGVPQEVVELGVGLAEGGVEWRGSRRLGKEYLHQPGS
jgi:hypothetical protein